MLDIFNSNAFGVVPLTDAINKLKFVPGRIGALGLFSPGGVASTSIAIEERNGQLVLVPPTNRGGPGTAAPATTKRSMLNVSIPHFEINDAVYAETVQGVRAFGDETALETVQGLIAERNAIHSQSFAATEEYARIGAIKGIITYADSSALNLFTLFGVSQESEIDFDLDNATPAAGALRKKCAGVTRQMSGILEGTPYSGIHAMCGDAFFDDLIAHPEVRETYLNQVEASQLRNAYIEGGQTYGSFNFGGITWENYRGGVGATTFVGTDKCHIFPLGVPGLFKTYYAPADYMETVNTIGQRMYGKMYEMANGKGMHLDVQMNALQLCTRPRTLIPGKRT